jgi:cell division protein FtsL
VSDPARRAAEEVAPPRGLGGAGALERAERGGGAKRPRGPVPSASPTTSGAAAPRARRRRKHHVGFAILTMLVVGTMVFGIASLNAVLAQTSFRIDEAERRIQELSLDNLELIRAQAQLSAPGRIAAWARRNGMRLPDDIRSLHAPGGSTAAPAGAADPFATTGKDP